ncbi:MAG: thermostable hemolysin [Pseudomonadales bacterium]|nr:thermostable hemolysin [Pseudomonadales bacterium]
MPLSAVPPTPVNPAVAESVSTPAFTLRPAATDEERTILTAFIEHQFGAHFSADVHINPPMLLGAWDHKGQAVAALGLREARHGFFSDNYLPTPALAALATDLGSPVLATACVEAVHLAVASPRLLLPLLDALALELTARGYDYLICTATGCLRRLFNRHGWRVHALGVADPAAIGTAALRWGRYYDASPAVIAGDLREAAVIAGTRGHWTHRA